MPSTKTKKRCRDCQWPITWAEQRKQWERCLRRGLSKPAAKAALPRCQKCLTRHLKQLETISDMLAKDGRLRTGDQIEPTQEKKEA